MSAEGASDAVNRRTWQQRAAEFVDLDSWTDRGERNAVMSLASRVRGARILDVGVGAGRTAWILPLLSDRYIAVDYTPAMVDAARAAHPARDIRVGDARDLEEIPDGTVDFAMFSWNGIDALDHADRQRALMELHRVLVPGGVLLYSTLNKEGRAFGETPRAYRAQAGRLRRVLRLGRHPRSTLARHGREDRNWARLSPRIEDRGEWGIAPLAAHDFGLLVHYTTLGGIRREVADHGFALESLHADSGGKLDPDSASTDALYVHVIATRPEDLERATP